MAADDVGPSQEARPAPYAEPDRPEAAYPHVTPDVTEVTETEFTETTVRRDGVAELDVTESVVTQPQPYPQPVYPQQPPYPQPPIAQPAAYQQPYTQSPAPQPSYAPYYGWVAPPPPPPRPRIPRRTIAAAIAAVLAAAGVVAGGLELAKPSTGAAAHPTAGSAAQDAAARAVWRTTPVDELLPPTITREGTESYIRLGINSDESCATLPGAFTAELAPTKCAHLLAATYVDRTQTVTATVGIVVISGTTTDRLRLVQVWNGDGAKGTMMPHAYSVPGTVASAFSDNQRVTWQSQVSLDGTYVTYAVTGFTDGRAGPGAAAIAAGSGSALSASSPAVQVAGDLPAAIQDLLTAKVHAAQAQGGTS